MQKFDNFRNRMGNNVSKLDMFFSAALDRINEAKWQKDALIDEIERLEEEIDAFPAIIEKALAEEDFETYKQATEEKARMEFACAAKEKRLEQNQNLQIDDFRDDWNAFKGEYEKEFCAAYSKYKEARKALYEQYKALQDLQKKAVILRKRIGLACGFPDHPWTNLDLVGEYLGIGKFSCLEDHAARNAVMKLAPDATFFASVGLLPAGEEEESYRVVAIKNI